MGPQRSSSAATPGLAAMNNPPEGSHKSVPSNSREIPSAAQSLPGPSVSNRRCFTGRLRSIRSSPNAGSRARIRTASAIPRGWHTALTQIVAAVNEINVGMAFGAEHRTVAFGFAHRRMASGVILQVGLRLDDEAAAQSLRGAPDQPMAEQPGRHNIRGRQIKTPRQDANIFRKVRHRFDRKSPLPTIRNQRPPEASPNRSKATARARAQKATVTAGA